MDVKGKLQSTVKNPVLKGCLRASRYLFEGLGAVMGGLVVSDLAAAVGDTVDVDVIMWKALVGLGCSVMKIITESIGLAFGIKPQDLKADEE